MVFDSVFESLLALFVAAYGTAWLEHHHHLLSLPRGLPHYKRRQLMMERTPLKTRIRRHPSLYPRAPFRRARLDQGIYSHFHYQTHPEVKVPSRSSQLHSLYRYPYSTQNPDQCLNSGLKMEHQSRKNPPVRVLMKLDSAFEYLIAPSLQPTARRSWNIIIICCRYRGVSPTIRGGS